MRLWVSLLLLLLQLLLLLLLLSGWASFNSLLPFKPRCDSRGHRFMMIRSYTITTGNLLSHRPVHGSRKFSAYLYKHTLATSEESITHSRCALGTTTKFTTIPLSLFFLLLCIVLKDNGIPWYIWGVGDGHKVCGQAGGWACVCFEAIDPSRIYGSMVN